MKEKDKNDRFIDTILPFFIYSKRNLSGADINFIGNILINKIKIDKFKIKNSENSHAEK